jgi:hypothetical protein
MWVRDKLSRPLRAQMPDSYLLYCRTHRTGLIRSDGDAWRAMESIHDSGRVRVPGVSNVTLEMACAGAPNGATKRFTVLAFRENTALPIARRQVI